jgi:hypothetical protein
VERHRKVQRCDAAPANKQVNSLPVAQNDISAQEPLSKSLKAGASQNDIWKETSFLIATASGIKPVSEYAGNGLGLHSKRRNICTLHIFVRVIASSSFVVISIALEA